MDKIDEFQERESSSVPVPSFLKTYKEISKWTVELVLR